MYSNGSLQRSTLAHGPAALVVRLTVTLCLAAAPAAAQTAVDGDTLKLAGQTYRLDQIDAPETAQTCGPYAAGREATKALSGLMQGRAVACEHVTYDRYGRSVAICRADGRDMGADMVRQGHAWAFLRYGRRYVGLEDQARREGLGVHAHGCVAAWEWRAQRR